MTHVSPAERTRALSMLVLATFFWGLSFPVVKTVILLQDWMLPGTGDSWFGTVLVVAPRFVLALLLMVGLRPRDCWNLTASEWRQGLILGLFAGGGMILQNDGLHYTAASTSAFLTQFYAVLIPVWTTLKMRRNPGARVWICCALVLAGVAILGRFDWNALQFGRGEWETLLCSLFFMGQILTLERKEFAANRPFQSTFVMFVTQAVLFTGLAIVTAPRIEALLVPWTSPVWLAYTLILAGPCTYGAYLLMTTWQSKISATEAGLVYCFEPIFGSLMALVLPGVLAAWALVTYPNETATWTLLAGGGLITVANVLLQLKPPAKT